MRLSFCVACGVKRNLHHHHLLPKSRGGSDDESNIITLCQHHHGIIHNFTWKGHLAELIKAGMQRAKKEGKRIHGTPEEMERLHEIKRIEYLNYCKRLLPHLDPCVTRKEQAKIFQKLGIERFRKYKGTTGIWDDHGVLKVVRCLVRNNLYKEQNMKHGMNKMMKGKKASPKKKPAGKAMAMKPKAKAKKRMSY